MQFPPISRLIVSLRPKYSPQHPVFKHRGLCSCLNVRDQVLHPLIPSIPTNIFPGTLFLHDKRPSEFRSLLRSMFSLSWRTSFNKELVHLKSDGITEPEYLSILTRLWFGRRRNKVYISKRVRNLCPFHSVQIFSLTDPPNFRLNDDWRTFSGIKWEGGGGCRWRLVSI
jgi:hypothetical protein